MLQLKEKTTQSFTFLRILSRGNYTVHGLVTHKINKIFKKHTMNDDN